MDSQEITFNITFTSQLLDAIANKVVEKGGKPLLSAISEKIIANNKTENIEYDYSVNEVAKVTNKSTHTIRRHINKKLLKAYKVGKSWRITENNLKLYLNGE